MFQIDGKFLPIDTPFEHGDVQYPANWLRLASEEDKKAIGIIETPDPVRADDRYYWNGDIKQPKDLAQLKLQAIEQIKVTAGSLLSPTDWKVTRAAEGVKPIDADTLLQRAAIRRASDANEAAVNACTTVEQLIATQPQWPTPESVAPGNQPT